MHIRRKKFLGVLVGMVAMVQLSLAQFSITAQLPVNGMVTKNQLWNAVAMNQSSEQRSIKIQISLQDPQSGQVLMTGVSSLFTINSGTKIIQYQQVQPVQYSYFSGSINQNPEGFLPIGTYLVCFEIQGFQNEILVQLAQDCITVEVEPLAPPLLVTPEDTTHNNDLRPSFSWMPPSPIGMFANLNYDFLLSEVLQGQTPLDAIQFNLPIYSVGNLVQNFMPFPMGLPALDSGKTYAWQIIAKDQMRYGAKSEVWSFTCKKDSITNPTFTSTYVKITNKPSMPIYITNGLLRTEFEHETADSVVKVTIASFVSPDQILASYDMQVQQGLNYWEIDLMKKMSLQPNICYEMRIKCAGVPDYVLRFFHNEVE